MSERTRQNDDPFEEGSDTLAYFDPAYREDIVHNKAGRLSERQHEIILKWDYEIPPEEKEQVLDAIELEKNGPIGRWLLLLLFLPVVALLLFDLFQGSGKLFIPLIIITFGLVISFFAPNTLSIKHIGWRYQAETEARRKRFFTDDSARKIIRLEGTPNYETSSTVTMDGVAYSVERPLWQWLREHSQHVAVYAIEGWYPRHALSVEPLDVPIPE